MNNTISSTHRQETEVGKEKKAYFVQMIYYKVSIWWTRYLK